MTGGKVMVSISLCMIVKNEEAVLGRCLDCVREIADEIILVDTGSSDQTKEIGARYTDKIYDYPWKDDFSAARNFGLHEAKMDYVMWLDADDMITPDQRGKFLQLKAALPFDRESGLPVDVVMMKYAVAFDRKGRPTFSFYRERLWRNGKGFLFEGKVHEAVQTYGNVVYEDLIVEHRKVKSRDRNRNLRIYERMRKEGKILTPREQFYYARELYDHQRYTDAAKAFRQFLKMPDGWAGNKADACRFLAYCCYYMGNEAGGLQALLDGLKYGVPKAELCCDIGKHFMDRKQWKEAAFWYRAAEELPRENTQDCFLVGDCYGYLPCIQLSVCYDALGEREQAAYYHRKAGQWKPYGEEYLKNKPYFEFR